MLRTSCNVTVVSQLCTLSESTPKVFLSVMSDAIPYQTYRVSRPFRSPSPHTQLAQSKRNSHPHLTPTSISRPSSIAGSPSPSLSPSRTLNNERSPVPAGKVTPPSELLPASPQPANSEGDADDSSLTMSRQSPPPSSSSSSPSGSTVTKSGTKKSTFRHVPLRNVRSPLGTDTSNSPRSQHQSSLSVDGAPSPQKVVNASGPHQQSRADAGEITEVTNGTPSGHSTKHDVNPIDQPTPPPPLASREPSITPAPPQVPSKLPHPPSASRVPYRPGFQPNGRYRPLTDEFIALRSLKQEKGVERGAPFRINKVEKAKLSRRLEKLIDLHFCVPDSMAGGGLNGGNRHTRSASSKAGSTPALNHRRASSLFDLDIKNLRISDTAELWRGVVGNSKTFDIRGS